MDNAPAYTMRPKTGKEKIEDIPAPNAYNPDVAPIKENQPAYPFGVRPEIKVKNETPGESKALLVFFLHIFLTLCSVWSLIIIHRTERLCTGIGGL